MMIVDEKKLYHCMLCGPCKADRMQSDDACTSVLYATSHTLIR